MKITDEMVDIAMKAYHDMLRSLQHNINGKDLMGAALEAVAPMIAEAAAADTMAHITRLRSALQGLHDDIADYAKINNLGGYDNHWMKEARTAIGARNDT